MPPKSKSKSSGYLFTPSQDWFSFNIDTWRSFFPLVQPASPRVLEIGSWEGRSAVFMLTELCAKGGEITCIDHFDLMETPAGRERYRKITHNLTMTKKPFRIIDKFSVPALLTLLEEEMDAVDPGFDWIYVDGSHRSDDTLLDGELVWRLARKGAIVIFDDYGWEKEPKDSIYHPKRGIDAFLTLHAGEFTLLSSPTQYQVILQKSSEMRIGFLVKEKKEQKLADTLEYGIHIALAVDSSFAMPAAVTIRSIVDFTDGRITFYVVDLGLSERDRNRIRKSVPRTRRDVTVVYLNLEGDTLAKNVGKTWAKIDMIPVLPVERVLYLDADILARSDLRALWDTSMSGKPIAAVIDVGFPMGHVGVDGEPYFNAGVLLMDLTAIRTDFQALYKLAEGMTTSRFQDQDVLNTYFRGNWLSLSLTWNAQGLGTYAQILSAARRSLDLAEMRDPAIVHFTGPVNPGLELVLNPFVQPFNAKPWGYAGAPGHPFESEWWEVLEKTEWREWKSSEEYSAYCAVESSKAMQNACEKFKQRFTK